jgi:hypothetical protein
MSHVRVVPDLACLLRAEEVELDGVHRRNRRELDEPLCFAVRQTGAGNVLESGREQARRPLDAIGFGHVGHVREGVGRSFLRSCGPVTCLAPDTAGHANDPRSCWAYSFLTLQ